MNDDISLKRYSKKQRFIFLTFEGITYQPNSESSEPDIENMQVVGFAKGFSRTEAFKKLIQDNDYLIETSFDEVWCMRLADGGRYDCLFYLQET